MSTLLKPSDVSVPQPDPVPVLVEDEKSGEEKSPDFSKLFTEPAKEDAIFLVDASGSTLSDFPRPLGSTSVFDRMAEVCAEQGHAKNWIIFWNSEDVGHRSQESKFYKTGAHMIPFPVTPDKIKSLFQAVKPSVTNSCLTEPHLGFQAIPPQWLDKAKSLIFVTDGMIGYASIPDGERRTLNNLLIEALKKVKDHRVSILSVEPIVRDYGNAEGLRRAAGNDVFNLISTNNLTGMISKFVSYNPSGSFTQISSARAPPGFLSFGDKIFSEMNVDLFRQWLYQTIQESASLGKEKSEDLQTQLAQTLSGTLTVLCKDKPKARVNAIIRSFAQLFTLDEQQVMYLIADNVERILRGSAQVYAEVRANLKNLFKEANNALMKSVREAVGIQDQFVGYISGRSGNDRQGGGRVLSGPARLINKSSNFNRTRYPDSAFETVPVFPPAGRLTAMNEQCLRQWTRAVYGSTYNVPVMDDKIIFLVLGTVMIVVNSDVPEDIKRAYRKLGTVMLGKKRLNSDQTELDRLLARELPIPNNGYIEDFFGYMDSVMSHLKIKASRMKLWYEICKAISSDLERAQSRHCTDAINEDIVFEKVVADVVPEEIAYDYSCLITGIDNSATGGWKIKSHRTVSDHYCSPLYTLSENGYAQMLRNPVCPNCYKPLTGESFERIGKKVEFVLPKEYGVVQDEGKGDDRKGEDDAIPQLLSELKIGGDDTKGTLVILKGTVGSGKSTFADRAKKVVEARGGYCVVEGPDRYCQSMSPQSACQKVTQQLNVALRYPAKDKVVIVDCCGERSNGLNVFNVNFVNWKRVEVWPNLNRDDLEGYAAWSLRNVLLRKKPKKNDNHNLNPESAGEKTCIDVHRKKFEALFGGKAAKKLNLAYSTVDTLAGESNRYAATIKETPIEF